MKTIAITIEEDLIARMDRFAAVKGVRGNRSRIVREALREYLSHFERLTEENREREIFRKNRTKLTRQAAALVKEQTKREAR
jgi:metal-responsive CopG/Arc/MetJ family transcriptional regulator